MTKTNKIPLTFFQSLDVVDLAQQLLGKKIITQFSNKRTSGMIVETEAYKAPEDKASHAYQNKRTPRTQTMFEQGGTIYIYLCYGIHHLLNIVTGPKDCPHAILIRAIEPLEGTDIMLARRGLKKVEPRLTGGPGCLTKALGITTEHNGLLLNQEGIVIEHHQTIDKSKVLASPRVGVGYAQEDQHLPWRFRIKDNRWTSPAP